MSTSLNTTLRIAATLIVISFIALAGRAQAADAHFKAMRQLVELAKQRRRRNEWGFNVQARENHAAQRHYHRR